MEYSSRYIGHTPGFTKRTSRHPKCTHFILNALTLS